MIVSAYGFDAALSPGRVALDPSRVAAQVVTGIGFLGAGTILRQKQTVHGLTTAASVWAVAAVGLAAGGGLYAVAVGATALILVILAVIRPWEDQIRELGPRTLTLLVAHDGIDLADVEAALRAAGLEVRGVEVRRGEEHGERRIAVRLGHVADDRLLALVDRLQRLDGVREVGYEKP
jgi:putative Mg2+ transporter-C (MgtC) family protein